MTGIDFASPATFSLSRSVSLVCADQRMHTQTLFLFAHSLPLTHARTLTKAQNITPAQNACPALCHILHKPIVKAKIFPSLSSSFK